MSLRIFQDHWGFLRADSVVVKSVGIWSRHPDVIKKLERIL